MKSLLIFLIFVLLSVSCKDSKEKLPKAAPFVKQKETKKSVAQKGPIINIIDTVEIKRTILCLKDSAANMEILKDKLSSIFKKILPDAILVSKLKIIGDPMVWYQSNKAPFFFKAGIPVDKVPAKLSKGIFITKTGGDSALVAHFFGPLELLGVGHDALTDMLRENNKKRTSPAYEVYRDSIYLKNNEETNYYKLQTDIVMPYK